jgi:hypothetical protein
MAGEDQGATAVHSKAAVTARPEGGLSREGEVRSLRDTFFRIASMFPRSDLISGKIYLELL